MKYRLTRLGLVTSWEWTRLVLMGIAVLICFPIILIYLVFMLVVSLILDTVNLIAGREL